MAVNNYIQFQTLADIDTATIAGGTFGAVNPAGLTIPCFLIRITSTCNKDCYISFDGVTNHEFLPSDATVVLPFQYIGQPNNFTAMLKKGTIVWVKPVEAATGHVRLSGYCQASAV